MHALPLSIWKLLMCLNRPTLEISESKKKFLRKCFLCAFFSHKPILWKIILETTKHMLKLKIFFRRVSNSLILNTLGKTVSFPHPPFNNSFLIKKQYTLVEILQNTETEATT